MKVVILFLVALTLVSGAPSSPPECSPEFVSAWETAYNGCSNGVAFHILRKNEKDLYSVVDCVKLEMVNNSVFKPVLDACKAIGVPADKAQLDCMEEKFDSVCTYPEEKI